MCIISGMGNGNSNGMHIDGVERPRKRKNVIPRSDINMLSVKLVAKEYGFHQNTVRRWVTQDGLKCIRYGPGNKIYIAEKDVEKFIKRYYY